MPDFLMVEDDRAHTALRHYFSYYHAPLASDAEATEVLRCLKTSGLEVLSRSFDDARRAMLRAFKAMLPEMPPEIAEAEADSTGRVMRHLVVLHREGRP